MNYETRTVRLWIDNEEHSSIYWNDMALECFESADGDKDAAIYALATRMKDELSDTSELGLPGMYLDLLLGALSEVNWREIAELYMEDLNERMA